MVPNEVGNLFPWIVRRHNLPGNWCVVQLWEGCGSAHDNGSGKLRCNASVTLSLLVELTLVLHRLRHWLFRFARLIDHVSDPRVWVTWDSRA